MSAEQGDAAFVLLFAQKDDGAHLGHGLDDENAGHHRFLGKVALEKGFIAADTFAAHGPHPRLQMGDSVHQEKGVAVGQNFFDLIDIQFHYCCSSSKA